MMDDWELLQQYAGGGREDAFAELADRYLDLVYSAALRQVRSPELAEEVASSVFIDLARNARKLAPKTVLTPWLYTVARRTSVDVIRRESRRQSRERAAVADMNPHTGPWTEIEPLLDDAMEALDPADRSAILLRYFENKSLRDVGQALGTSEDAAQKRVSRAIERLRDFFARQGVATEGASLAVLISSHAIQSAPPALKTAILPASAAGLTKTIAMTAMQKFCVVAALAATVGTACYEAQQVSALKAQIQTLRTQSAPAAARNDSLSQALDDANRRFAILQSENNRLQSNTADLARLRGEVSLLRSAAKDPTADAMKSWLARVNQLKAHLDRTPGARIPEMQFLNDDNWLNAARGDLNTDDDYRRAMSFLRGEAENKFVGDSLKPALDKFAAANGHYPATFAELQPFFESPMDDAVLQRWEIVPQSVVPNVGVGPTIVTQVAAVDEGYDSRIVVGSSGTGSTSGLGAWDPDATKVLGAVYQAYENANNGTPPADMAQLQPFASTPEQQAALQKALSIKVGNSASSH